MDYHFINCKKSCFAHVFLVKNISNGEVLKECIKLWKPDEIKRIK